MRQRKDTVRLCNLKVYGNNCREIDSATKSSVKQKTTHCPVIDLGFQIEPSNAPEEKKRPDIPSIFRAKENGYLARIIETQKKRDADYE